MFNTIYFFLFLFFKNILSDEISNKITNEIINIDNNKNQKTTENIRIFFSEISKYLSKEKIDDEEAKNLLKLLRNTFLNINIILDSFEKIENKNEYLNSIKLIMLEEFNKNGLNNNNNNSNINLNFYISDLIFNLCLKNYSSRVIIVLFDSIRYLLLDNKMFNELFLTDKELSLNYLKNIIDKLSTENNINKKIPYFSYFEELSKNNKDFISIYKKEEIFNNIIPYFKKFIKEIEEKIKKNLYNKRFKNENKYKLNEDKNYLISYLYATNHNLIVFNEKPINLINLNFIFNNEILYNESIKQFRENLIFNLPYFNILEKIKKISDITDENINLIISDIITLSFLEKVKSFKEKMKCALLINFIPTKYTKINLNYDSGIGSVANLIGNSDENRFLITYGGYDPLFVPLKTEDLFTGLSKNNELSLKSEILNLDKRIKNDEFKYISGTKEEKSNIFNTNIGNKNIESFDDNTFENLILNESSFLKGIYTGDSNNFTILKNTNNEKYLGLPAKNDFKDYKFKKLISINNQILNKINNTEFTPSQENDYFNKVENYLILKI